VQGKVNVLKEQMKSVRTQDAPIVNEAKSIDVQIAKLTIKSKSKITNPIKGTVLAKYAEPNEITAFGKPLYKIADISEMTLRVYVSETQKNKVGQQVNVKIDTENEMKPIRNSLLDCISCKNSHRK
jgi:HlyD family secretion protein